MPKKKRKVLKPSDLTAEQLDQVIPLYLYNGLTYREWFEIHPQAEQMVIDTHLAAALATVTPERTEFVDIAQDTSQELTRSTIKKLPTTYLQEMLYQMGIIHPETFAKYFSLGMLEEHQHLFADLTWTGADKVKEMIDNCVHQKPIDIKS